MNYLAFDLGGSSGKLLLAKIEDGKLKLQKVHQFPNQPLEEDGNLYWDIRSISKNLKEGIKKAVELTGDDISGFGADSFCNDHVLIDEKGEILSPVFCYRDARTTRNEEAFYQVMSRQELYSVNGNQNAVFNALNHIHAAKVENADYAYRVADKMLFLSDYLLYELTGVKQTEYTTASVSQFFDYGKMDWSDLVMEKYGIDRNILAPLSMPGNLTGKTSLEFNDTVGTKGFPVYTVCQHDTASAFLASIGGEDSAIVSTGTWCLVGMEAEGPVIKQEGFEANVANEGGYRGKHHRLLKNVMGTWIIQEMLREYNLENEEMSFGELEKLAIEAGLQDHFIDVDAPEFFEPGNMFSKVCEGSNKLYGKSFQTIGETVAAVYESLAFKYRMTMETLERLTGTSLKVINMIGGGINSEMMCQLTANICGRKVIAGPEDAASLGNIITQMVASGEIPDIEAGRDLIRNTIEIKEYYPDGNPLWEEHYKEFCSLLANK
ncbi:MAG: rhamnulokinase [Lachnospiraceae bacterium]|nr:rhamnulokinase [Lachnospiraceae bacterium]